MALALDGSVAGNSSSAGSLGVSLTTSNSDDVICVLATVNGGPVTSVTATGLSFTKRANVGVSASSQIELWTAVAASTLSSLTITVAQTSSSFITVCAFGVSGADTSTIWDSNGGLPATSTSAASITTDNDDCFLIGGMRTAGPSPSLPGAGWTAISVANFQVAEYQIISSAASSVAVTKGDGGTANGIIGDAIIAAAGGGFQPAWAINSTRTITGGGMAI